MQLYIFKGLTRRSALILCEATFGVLM